MPRLIPAVALHLLLILAVAGSSSPAHGSDRPIAVYVVGDSLNDTGTFAPVTATGRFTTTPGLLWTEIVANRLGASVAPAHFFDGTAFVANPGGTNYAQSGALVATDGGLYDGHSRSIAWQVDRLLEHGGGDLADAWVLIDGGGPDLILAAVQVQQGELRPDQAVLRVEAAADTLAEQTGRLAAAGADTIVLLGVADFGAVPLFGAGQGETAAFLTRLSERFNAALATALAARGVDPVQPDVFSFFDRVIADPAAHGLANVTDPAVDPDRTPPTPTGTSANSNPYHLVQADAATRFLFADGLHPSAAGHALLAEFVWSMLPPEVR